MAVGVLLGGAERSLAFHTTPTCTSPVQLLKRQFALIPSVDVVDRFLQPVCHLLHLGWVPTCRLRLTRHIVRSKLSLLHTSLHSQP